MLNGLITIAIGKKYVQQAKYLAYSCILNSPHTLRAVVTDTPKSLNSLFDIIIPYKEEFGNPFSIKPYINHITPYDKTLYIDADSLVFHPLDSFFPILDSIPFAYTGSKISSGIWYMDIKKTIAEHNVEWMPKLNSGMLLFKKDSLSDIIFDTAREMYKKYHDSEIAFFRKEWLPDEPFFSLALAKNHIEPFNDNGRFSYTLIDAIHIKINVLKHLATFLKRGRQVFPVIVHFCGRFGSIYYFFERQRLFSLFNNPLKMAFSFFLSLLRTGIKNQHGV